MYMSQDSMDRPVARKRNSYKLTAPDGTIYETDNIVAWCKGKGLIPNGFRMVANGHRPHYKGWGAIKIKKIKKTKKTKKIKQGL